MCFDEEKEMQVVQLLQWRHVTHETRHVLYKVHTCVVYTLYTCAIKINIACI